MTHCYVGFAHRLGTVITEIFALVRREFHWTHVGCIIGWIVNASFLFEHQRIFRFSLDYLSIVSYQIFRPDNLHAFHLL